MNSRNYSALDQLIIGFEKVNSGAGDGNLPDAMSAGAQTNKQAGMTGEEARLTAEQTGMPANADGLRSAALMRVNHAGEVAAQALYAGHALVAKDMRVRDAMLRAAAEEGDHLDWCATRVRELGSHVSFLTPLWYFGSLAIGAAAGSAGDKWSLGFVMETERQVVEHLDRHLQRLPEQDRRSRAILQQMRSDEAHHASAAQDAGAAELPLPLRLLMRACAKVMTGIAYRL